MKKALYVGLILIFSAAFLSGCGKKDQLQKQIQSASTSPAVTPKEVADAAKQAEELNQALERGNTGEVAEALGKIMELGADMEVREYELLKAVNLPPDFLDELNYSGGKVVAIDDYSDDDYLDLRVEIMTLDDPEKAVEYYKNQLSKKDWRITSQSSRSDGADYYAKNEESGHQVGVNILRNSYSKITIIAIELSLVKQD